MKKAAYPVCLFLLTAVVLGFSLLKNRLNYIMATTYSVRPMWILLVCYFLLGGIFVIALAVKKKSELKPSVLVILNLAFGILNLGLYLYFWMNPIIYVDDVFLLFGGFLIFSAPPKLCPPKLNWVITAKNIPAGENGLFPMEQTRK